MTYRPCTSCGKPCSVAATTDAPVCHACRKVLCARCGQPHKRRGVYPWRWSPFCSAECRDAYKAQEVTAA